MASLEDAERITSLINCAFRRAEEFFIDEDRIDLESVRNFFETGKFLLGESDGIVVACVYVELRGNRAYLGLLSVDPARQHSGLGSLLMDEAEGFCRGLACRFISLHYEMTVSKTEPEPKTIGSNMKKTNLGGKCCFSYREINGSLCS